MDFISENQWYIFIGLEITSLLFLISFLIIRYAFNKEKLARIFLVLFILFIFLEALLALAVYRETGKIDTFQVIIFLFVVYACTFGIADFKRLDRYIKGLIGKWRGIDLLTEKDKQIIAHLRDPKVIARKNRNGSIGHTLVFLITLTIFWLLYGNDIHPVTYYVMDWSWFEGDSGADLPFTSNILTQLTQIWLIIWVIDTIIAWSYTFFPSKQKDVGG